MKVRQRIVGGTESHHVRELRLGDGKGVEHTSTTWLGALLVTLVVFGLAQRGAVASECGETFLQAKVSEMPELGGQFGSSVDIRGDLALVGSAYVDGANTNSGIAEIFRFDGTDWVLEATLEPTSSVDGTRFGVAVAISDRLAIVGTETDEAYVFRHDGSSWNLEQLLTGIAGSGYGLAVDIDDTVAIVGAPYASSFRGRAHIYRFDGSMWIQEIGFQAGGSLAGFGISVKIQGDRAVCGAPGATSSFGEVYVYDFDGTAWSQSRLSQSSPALESDFGKAVDLSRTGDTILVGQPWVNSGRGAAWVFAYDGTDWIEGERLVSDPRQDDERFGSTVAMSYEGVAIVGAPNRGSNRGAAYAFSKVAEVWELSSKIVPEDRYELQFFSWSLAVDGATAIVGAIGDSLALSGAGAAYFVDVPLCAIRCREGVVDIANGTADDVLFVNGSAGTSEVRTIAVDADEVLWITMLSAPSGGPGKFVVHANLAEPSDATLSTLPASIGLTCFEMILNAGATPHAVWNNIGKEGAVGATLDFDGGVVDPDRAPCIFVEIGEGDLATVLPPGTVLTLQGVLLDPGSSSPKSASATNAVVVEIL